MTVLLEPDDRPLLAIVGLSIFMFYLLTVYGNSAEGRRRLFYSYLGLPFSAMLIVLVPHSNMLISSQPTQF